MPTVVYISRERGVIEASSRRYTPHPMSCLVRNNDTIRDWCVSRWKCAMMFTYNHLYFVATVGITTETCFVRVHQHDKKPMVAILYSIDSTGLVSVYKITSWTCSATYPVVAFDSYKMPKSSVSYTIVTSGHCRVPYNPKDWLFELDGAIMLGSDSVVIGMYAHSEMIMLNTIIDLVKTPVLNVKPTSQPNIQLFGRFIMVNNEPIRDVTTQQRVTLKTSDFSTYDIEHARWDIGDLVRRGLDVMTMWTRTRREEGVLSM
jgi:hypothetical protein